MTLPSCRLHPPLVAAAPGAPSPRAEIARRPPVLLRARRNSRQGDVLELTHVVKVVLGRQALLARPAAGPRASRPCAIQTRALIAGMGRTFG